MIKIIGLLISFICITDCSAKNLTENINEQLYRATRQGDYSKVKELVNQGADVNYKKQFLTHDEFPLNGAIKGGNIEIVKLLVDRGAKIDTETDDRSSLNNAIWMKNKKIIRFLIKSGIYIDRSCSSSLIFSAMYSRSFEMMKYVIEDLHVCIDSREIHYQHTPLYKTVCEDLYQEAQYLIKRGANVNIPNKDNETPLHVAVTGKRFKFIELLLKNGADPSIKDAKGLTPLDYAKQANNRQIIKLLMRYGK